MKLIVSFLLFALFIYGGTVEAQDTKLGTTRSEDLQLKAKIEYEKRNQKQPQQVQNQAQNPRPKTPSENMAGKPDAQTTPPPTKSVTAPTAKSVICKHGAETRELYIEDKGLGCELFYTKAGSTKSQARQSNGKNICESVYEKMKVTLEKTGFVCEQKTN